MYFSLSPKKNCLRFSHRLVSRSVNLRSTTFHALSSECRHFGDGLVHSEIDLQGMKRQILSSDGARARNLSIATRSISSFFVRLSSEAAHFDSKTSPYQLRCCKYSHTLTHHSAFMVLRLGGLNHSDEHAHSKYFPLPRNSSNKLT